MPAFADPAALRQISLFRDVTDIQLERINSLLHRSRYPSGRTVLHAEQPGELVYIVYEGMVQVRTETTADGIEGPAERAQVILALLGKGEIIGEMSVVDSMGRSATVETREDCVLLWLDRGAFWECLRTMPSMTYALTQILSRRLRIANARIQALANLDVGGRIAYHLLALAREHGEEDAEGNVLIPFRLTHEEIAELVGATRVRVTQVLSSWKKARWLSADGASRITLKNRAALTRLCF